MTRFDLIKRGLTKVVGRKILIIRKYSPEILIAVGIVGLVSSTVMACKATTKASIILDDLHSDVSKINVVKETSDKPVVTTEDGDIHFNNYSEMDYKKDMGIVYLQSTVKLVKLYAPAVTLGIASIGCILGAHNIMYKRNVALMAAYKAIEQSFNTYRNRVIEEFGSSKDWAFKNGIREREVTIVEEDEKGKKRELKKTALSVDPNAHSVYAKFFDEFSTEWDKSPEHNLIFLKCQQTWANDMLRARGHLFLNEVYDHLGIERTQAGAVVGWVLNKEGDNFVDFGIYDLYNLGSRNFVNGRERSILLDFNVDGVIWDKI